MKTYDTIVIGLGAMGSATVNELAQRGQRVLGLEQYAFDHHLGSAHGQSRIIRQAYFEHPDYVPLLQAAYRGWEALAQSTDTELINLCGLLMAGPPEGEVIAGTRSAAARHGLPLIDVAAAGTAYPGFRLPPDDTVLLDPLGGYLRVEACVAANLANARRLGAELHEKVPVQSWHVEGNSVSVATATDRYTANRLILCAGAWSTQLLASLGLPLEVRRVVTAWFPDEHATYQREKGCPVFAFQTDAGFFYGFPELDRRGVKLACHEAGALLSDPATVNRTVSEADVQPLQRFATQYLPHLNPAPKESTVCLYTMSPDGHFIIDHHPDHPQVVFAAGFSGHGFKFCPVIGAILADLSTEGKTSLPCAFLGLDRPALRPS